MALRSFPLLLPSSCCSLSHFLEKSLRSGVLTVPTKTYTSWPQLRNVATPSTSHRPLEQVLLQAWRWQIIERAAFFLPPLVQQVGLAWAVTSVRFWTHACGFFLSVSILSRFSRSTCTLALPWDYVLWKSISFMSVASCTLVVWSIRSFLPLLT